MLPGPVGTRPPIPPPLRYCAGGRRAATRRTTHPLPEAWPAGAPQRRERALPPVVLPPLGQLTLPLAWVFLHRHHPRQLDPIGDRARRARQEQVPTHLVPPRPPPPGPPPRAPSVRSLSSP